MSPLQKKFSFEHHLLDRSTGLSWKMKKRIAAWRKEKGPLKIG